MDYLIKNQQLELKYQPGKGAWTYHLQIPNTKHLVGKWGSLKVSSFIDEYKVEAKNLFTIKGQDKLLTINDTIRKTINKSGEDWVTVTLYLLTSNKKITEKEILDTFTDAEGLKTFKQLSQAERKKVLEDILSKKHKTGNSKLSFGILNS